MRVSGKDFGRAEAVNDDGEMVKFVSYRGSCGELVEPRRRVQDNELVICLFPYPSFDVGFIYRSNGRDVAEPDLLRTAESLLLRVSQEVVDHKRVIVHYEPWFTDGCGGRVSENRYWEHQRLVPRGETSVQQLERVGAELGTPGS